MACYCAVSHLKAKFGYDDSLDVFGVHGVGSTVGMLMLGLLASPSVNSLLGSTFKKGDQVVSLAGSGGQLVNQIIGVAVTAALSAIATAIILAVLKATIGLRVTEEEEFVGLDITQHGERAYND
jgi:Amt family ammonium transporter